MICCFPRGPIILSSWLAAHHKDLFSSPSDWPVHHKGLFSSPSDWPVHHKALFSSPSDWPPTTRAYCPLPLIGRPPQGRILLSFLIGYPPQGPILLAFRLAALHKGLFSSPSDWLLTMKALTMEPRMACSSSRMVPTGHWSVMTRCP